MLSIAGAAVLEHRTVVENIIGRKLSRWEFVHHIDGNPANNTPSNLLIVSPKKHGELHAKYFRSDTHKQCATCLCVFERAYFPKGPKSGSDPHGRNCRRCKRELQKAARRRANPTAHTRNRPPIYVDPVEPVTSPAASPRQRAVQAARPARLQASAASVAAASMSLAAG